jgi:hypothetical protein
MLTQTYGPPSASVGFDASLPQALGATNLGG